MEKSVALVIGASRGLGFFLSIELAKSDYHVICVARTVGGLEALDDEIKEVGGTATLAPLDITDKKAIENLCHNIFLRWKKIDLLILSAIYAAPLTPVEHIDQKDLQKSIETNLTSTQVIISMTQPLLKFAKKGLAVFFSDHHYKQKFFGAYDATKNAQISLALNWKKENSNNSIEVLVLEPEAMATASRARFHPGEEKDLLKSPEKEAQRLVQIINQASVS